MTDWRLVFGASLMFGAWCLVFRTAVLEVFRCVGPEEWIAVQFEPRTTRTTRKAFPISRGSRLRKLKMLHHRGKAGFHGQHGNYFSSRSGFSGPHQRKQALCFHPGFSTLVFLWCSLSRTDRTHTISQRKPVEWRAVLPHPQPSPAGRGSDAGHASETKGAPLVRSGPEGSPSPSGRGLG